MNSTQINYFLALCDYKNYSETARRLYVSQSTISKQIVLLEKELGFKLFERSTSSLKLTMQGAIMKKAYTEVVDHIKSAQSEALNYGNQIADTVHIGILEGSDISNILFQPLSDIIFSFKDSISIKISSFSYKKLNAALHENAIDIAFTLINEVADHTDIGFTKLRSIPMGLVFHRDLNLVSENKVNMEVFSKTPFFATSDGSLGFKKFIEMQKKHLQIQISNIRIMPNIPSIITNIELKQGCSIVLNTPQIENNPDLVFFPLENMSTTIVAAWNKSNENKSRERISKKIRRLIIESRKS